MAKPRRTATVRERPLATKSPLRAGRRSTGILACVGLIQLFAATTQAAIWPEQLGAAKRVAAKPIQVTEKPLWAEYGLHEPEQAEYDGPQKFTALAYRLQDSTAALGAYEWQRPANSKPSTLGKQVAETPTQTILAHGNYLLIFQGYTPKVPELEALFQTFPKLDQSSLPALMDYLPREGLLPNSERYVIGPVG